MGVKTKDWMKSFLEIRDNDEINVDLLEINLEIS